MFTVNLRGLTKNRSIQKKISGIMHFGDRVFDGENGRENRFYLMAFQVEFE